MSHRGMAGLAMLCKPSSRHTAGAWPGQGGGETLGPHEPDILGGLPAPGERRKEISSRARETLQSAPVFASKQLPITLQSTVSSSRAKRAPWVAAQGPWLDGAGWGDEMERGRKPERPAPPAVGKPSFKGEEGAASLQSRGDPGSSQEGQPVCGGRMVSREACRGIATHSTAPTHPRRPWSHHPAWLRDPPSCPFIGNGGGGSQKRYLLPWETAEKGSCRGRGWGRVARAR